MALFSFALTFEFCFIILSFLKGVSPQLHFVLSPIHIICGFYFSWFFKKSNHKVSFYFTLFANLSGLLLFFAPLLSKSDLFLKVHIISSLALFVNVLAFSFKNKNYINFSSLGATLISFVCIVLFSKFETTFTKTFPNTSAVFKNTTDSFSDFANLNQSQNCKKCHSDIFEQWNSSVHHNSSFNNIFYKKTFELMEKEVGFEKTNFCGSCHDPIVMFTGNFKEGFDKNSQEANSGITCIVCHSISGTESLKGNANYIFEVSKNYPFYHEAKDFSNYLVKLNPRIHKETYSKPFLNNHQLCGSCHKVGVTKEINDYTWKRGQNEFDAWHYSGTTRNNPESFYLPENPKNCRSCHMPLVDSEDFGSKDGKIKGHRFHAANTAIPFLKNDSTQIELVKNFLQDSKLKVSIVAVKEFPKSNISTIPEDFTKISMPLDSPKSVIPTGKDLIVDVVIRNKGVGHKYPGGVIDSFSDWLEFEVKNNEKTILVSGYRIENEIDSTAHFLNGFLLDGDGNRIQRRDVWNWKTILYNHQIPPSQSQVVHYKIQIPDSLGEITFVAKLNHNKFNSQFLNFVYEGEEIPNFPIFPIAQDSVKIITGKEFSGILSDKIRWGDLNDYGIGLLAQGDFLGAEKIFNLLTEIKPDYADGFVNLGISLIQNSKIQEAKKNSLKALEIDENCVRAKIQLGRILQLEGDLDEAESKFKEVLTDFPLARNVILNLGRTQYLRKKYSDAVQTFNKLLEIDPERKDAHFNLMLCYKEIGDLEKTKEHKELFEKYKDDDLDQIYFGKFVAKNPEFAKEGNKIHIHELTSIEELEKMYE
ncbi:MAG: hypothetical protein DWQ06_08230 [Calditrichaeota bacterium]|nr:MAG: hypothetical protein DWQ06_08230 [Calditrichota bacterium]